MKNLKDISAGKKAPDVVNAIIEIPRGSRNKYEYDVELGIFRLDRVLYSAVHYPTAYGFIPHTLWDDGDPLDILVIIDEDLAVGVLVDVRPVGMLRMEDDKGSDNKILGVAVHDPRYEAVRDVHDVQKHRLVEIEHFFETYKHLEKRSVKSYGWSHANAAKEAIRKAMDKYERNKAF
jgi:inorganic pyrophosphatase